MFWGIMTALKEEKVNAGGRLWGREGLSCTCGVLVGFWFTNLLRHGLDPSHWGKPDVTKINGNEELCNY